MASLPYPMKLTVPVGDSITLRWTQPRDLYTGQAIDLSAYDDVEFAAAPVGQDTPALAITAGPKLYIELLQSRITALLYSSDTTLLGIGEFDLQCRLKIGANTRHTLQPYHRLILIASPLA